ncbi:MAG: hypothetical protein K2P17_05555 [Helicobacteraceae bacterium]|nr:hypothetical protein [Helicobacteraceae bacterium]
MRINITQNLTTIIIDSRNNATKIEIKAQYIFYEKKEALRDEALDLSGQTS